MNPVSEIGVYRSWDVGFQQFNQLKRGNEFICEGFEAAGNMQLRSLRRKPRLKKKVTRTTGKIRIMSEEGS